MGYDGHFAEKCMGEPEGVALFFRREKFLLEEIKSLHLNDLAAHSFKQTEIPKFAEVVLLATLRHKTSNNLLVVGTCIFLKYIKFYMEMMKLHEVLLNIYFLKLYSQSLEAAMMD